MLVLGAAPLPDAGIERDLLLDVVVNGRPIGLLGDFHERGHQLYATRRELISLGLKPVSSTKQPDPNELVALSAIGGLSYRVDEATQTVYVTAKTENLVPSELAVDAGGSAAIPLQSSLGAVLNYSAVGTLVNGLTVANGLMDTRVFSPWGVADSSLLLQSGGARDGGTPLSPVVRLDTTYTFSDAGNLRRYRVGDFITGGLAWTRPLRLGGVQMTTDFSLRPDLVTFPVPLIAGLVAVPSSVDVLVNGVQQLSRDVEPGPFEIRQLPIVTGAGTVSVVIHDALGQQVTQTLPFYASGALLAAGLSSLSAEVGTVREQYGTRSNDYRTSAASASYRRGVADWLTLEAHGEGAAGVVMGGGGGSVAVGRFGVVSLAAAASRSRRGMGHLVSAGFEHIAPVLSLNGSVQMSDASYQDIAAVLGEPVPLLLARAGAGLSMGRWGSFGVAYALLQRPASTLTLPSDPGDVVGIVLGSGAVRQSTRTSLLSASYSRTVLDGRAYMYATGYDDLANAHSAGLLAGVSMPLGARSSLGISAGLDGGQATGAVQATQSAASVGDYGWQALGSGGQAARALATGQYRSSFGLFDAGVDHSAGQTSLRATAQGALAYAAGHVFASNTIADSFAVVDTGEPGIQVLQENRPVGRTGASGLLLVPDMRSYEANRIGIDPRDVPLDAEIGETTRLVRPRDRSGVVVKFPVRRNHGAVVRLVDGAGHDLPLGSTARLRGTSRAASVGYDGQAFLTGLERHNLVDVSMPDGTACVADVAYLPAAGRLPRIGPVHCRAEHAQ